jgi:hypothetical protein
LILTVTKGSCLCGEVHYEIEGDFDHFFLCHCEYCRKDTGSAHASNLISMTGKLCWLKGEQRVKVFNLPGTRHVKSFCSECGSALPSFEGNILVVPVGSIDGDVNRRPDAHIFAASRADWDHDLDLLPKMDTFPEQ